MGKGEKQKAVLRDGWMGWDLGMQLCRDFKEIVSSLLITFNFQASLPTTRQQSPGVAAYQIKLP